MGNTDGNKELTEMREEGRLVGMWKWHRGTGVLELVIIGIDGTRVFEIG